MTAQLDTIIGKKAREKVAKRQHENKADRHSNKFVVNVSTKQLRRPSSAKFYQSTRIVPICPRCYNLAFRGHQNCCTDHHTVHNSSDKSLTRAYLYRRKSKPDKYQRLILNAISHRE